MAISAVSAVSYGNNYNNISFEGKKKKKAQKSENYTSHTNASRLAVPLAAALTLMPISSAKAKNYNNITPEHVRTEYAENLKSNFVEEINDGGVIIESKKFDTKEYGQISVNLKSTDGDDSNFEEVEVSFKVYETRTKTVVPKTLKIVGPQEFGPYRLTSQDDTEEQRKDIKIKTVLMKDDNYSNNKYYCNNEEFMEYIDALREDPRNHNKAISKTVIPRHRLHTDGEGALHYGGYGPSLKNAKPIDTSGMKKIDEAEFPALGEKYILRCYSNNNSDKIDKVTLEKLGNGETEGFEEVFINKLIIPTHIIYPNSDNPLNFVTGIVELEDGSGKEYILNKDVLTNTLYAIRRDNDMGNAYSVEKPTHKYLVFQGAFANLVE